VFSGTILGTQMIPGILFLLPLFLIFVNLDKALGFELFYQTRFGLIIVFMTFTPAVLDLHVRELPQRHSE
jgi:multiple sugar transport system permease protein